MFHAQLYAPFYNRIMSVVHQKAGLCFRQMSLTSGSTVFEIRCIVNKSKENNNYWMTTSAAGKLQLKSHLKRQEKKKIKTFKCVQWGERGIPRLIQRPLAIRMLLCINLYAYCHPVVKTYRNKESKRREEEEEEAFTELLDSKQLGSNLRPLPNVVVRRSFVVVVKKKKRIQKRRIQRS